MLSLVNHPPDKVLLCFTTYHPYLVQGRAHYRHQETIMNIINELLLHQGMSYLDGPREKKEIKKSTLPGREQNNIIKIGMTPGNGPSYPNFPKDHTP